MDNNQAQEKQVEGQLPSDMGAESKPIEVSTQNQVEESTTATDNQQGELPEDVSERTRKEFEKLKAANAELAKKLKEVSGTTSKKKSVLDMFSPQVKTEDQNINKAVDVPIQEVKPDENGYVDLEALNKTIKAINDRTKAIEEQAKKAQNVAVTTQQKVAEYEHTATTKQVYKEFPELDPNSEQFDEAFSERVRNEIFGQMVTTGKENYMEAAKKVKGLFSSNTNDEEAKKIAKIKENSQKADEINSLQGNKSNKSQVDNDTLIRESWRGNKDAIYERLRRSGF